jgi:polyribonucleotide nucleotidyltransferase
VGSHTFSALTEAQFGFTESLEDNLFGAFVLAHDIRARIEVGEFKNYADEAPKRHAMVRTICDLKPGMHVYGIVTNFTKFGAFVNIGFTTEAMIHLSQLSMEYSSPQFYYRKINLKKNKFPKIGLQVFIKCNSDG